MQAGMSPYHFHRVFKRFVGVTPRAYAAAHRQNRVGNELRSGAGVTEAFYAAGFGSSSRFYELAPDILGMKPLAYRDGGAGEAIWCAVGRSSIGYVLVAATERGVCAILLGDSPTGLIDELGTRFPKAILGPPKADFAAVVQAVIHLIDNPTRPSELPLDIRGTAFQRRVWEILRRIPPGETASYTQVAERLGMPRSARAVAGACAANPLAVAIPCHRVVASDGELAGYRWGIERKRRLLERESR
jgi:AraC family transcriptional regulator of adaptative response/methylated-DNA-[protein]-cysteine methyltransferase